MKVIGIGLNKTGTTTLSVCLKHWKLRHISCSLTDFELWRQGDLDALLARAATYDSFEDWPWPLVYQEMDRAFPGSKFILTRRKNADVWFDSLCKHADRRPNAPYREAIYGYAMPHGHRDAHIAFYENHLASVRAYFRDRPGDLLEVCWEEGDGWAELVGFLGFEAPSISFPHANKRPPAPEQWMISAKRRAQQWFGYGS